MARIFPPYSYLVKRAWVRRHQTAKVHPPSAATICRVLGLGRGLPARLEGLEVLRRGARVCVTGARVCVRFRRNLGVSPHYSWSTMSSSEL
jgi:hypothetical protein